MSYMETVRIREAIRKCEGESVELKEDGTRPREVSASLGPHFWRSAKRNVGHAGVRRAEVNPAVVVVQTRERTLVDRRSLRWTDRGINTDGPVQHNPLPHAPSSTPSRLSKQLLSDVSSALTSRAVVP